MVTRMNDQKMGLVHQLPFTTDQSGFAAAVEKVLHGILKTICEVFLQYVSIACNAERCIS